MSKLYKFSISLLFLVRFAGAQVPLDQALQLNLSEEQLYITIDGKKLALLSSSGTELANWTMTEHWWHVKSPEQNRASLICQKYHFARAFNLKVRKINTDESTFDILNSKMAVTKPCFVPSIQEKNRILRVMYGADQNLNEPIRKYLANVGYGNFCGVNELALATSLGLVKDPQEQAVELGEISSGDAFVSISCQ